LQRRLFTSHALASLAGVAAFWLLNGFGRAGAALATVSVMVVWFIVSRWVERSITLPLVRLRDGVRKIGEGDLDHSVEHRSSDVIGELALAMNSTGRRLGELHYGLWQANRELEQRVSERTRELEERNRMLESVINTISHDLRATAVSMQGVAGILLEDSGAGLTRDALRNLRRLLAMTEYQEHLLRDLATLVRIGKEPAQLREVELEELLKDVIEGCREEGGHVELHANLPVALPLVYSDPGRLRVVLRHLIQNAIKFMGDQPDPEVEISAREHEDWVQCSVRDNGIGIDPAYHEKIFELFHQLREMETSGTGAGLAIAKQIVEQSGGRIWVESQKGCGTTVSFTVPKAALPSSHPSYQVNA
jgi:signal transduction histidine kinase